MHDGRQQLGPAPGVLLGEVGADELAQGSDAVREWPVALHLGIADRGGQRSDPVVAEARRPTVAPVEFDLGVGDQTSTKPKRIASTGSRTS